VYRGEGSLRSYLMCFSRTGYLLLSLVLSVILVLSVFLILHFALFFRLIYSLISKESILIRLDCLLELDFRIQLYLSFTQGAAGPLPNI